MRARLIYSRITSLAAKKGERTFATCGVEVKLQQAIGLARTGHCEEALATAKTLASPVPGLAFTQDGLKPLLDSTRTNYLVGETLSTCGQKE